MSLSSGIVTTPRGGFLLLVVFCTGFVPDMFSYLVPILYRKKKNGDNYMTNGSRLPQNGNYRKHSGDNSYGINIVISKKVLATDGGKIGGDS